MPKDNEGMKPLKRSGQNNTSSKFENTHPLSEFTDAKEVSDFGKTITKRERKLALQAIREELGMSDKKEKPSKAPTESEQQIKRRDKQIRDERATIFKETLNDLGIEDRVNRLGGLIRSMRNRNGEATMHILHNIKVNEMKIMEQFRDSDDAGFKKLEEHDRKELLKGKSPPRLV